MSKECEVYNEENGHYGDIVAHGYCRSCYHDQIADWFEKAKKGWERVLDSNLALTSEKFELLDKKPYLNPTFCGIFFIMEKMKNEQDFAVHASHETLALPAPEDLEPLEYEDIKRLDACGVMLGEHGFEIFT